MTKSRKDPSDHDEDKEMKYETQQNNTRDLHFIIPTAPYITNQRPQAATSTPALKQDPERVIARQRSHKLTPPKGKETPSRYIQRCKHAEQQMEDTTMHSL